MSHIATHTAGVPLWPLSDPEHGSPGTSPFEWLEEATLHYTQTQLQEEEEEEASDNFKQLLSGDSILVHAGPCLSMLVHAGPWQSILVVSPCRSIFATGPRKTSLDQIGYPHFGCSVSSSQSWLRPTSQLGTRGGPGLL